MALPRIALLLAIVIANLYLAIYMNERSSMLIYRAFAKSEMEDTQVECISEFALPSALVGLYLILLVVVFKVYFQSGVLSFLALFALPVAVHHFTKGSTPSSFHGKYLEALPGIGTPLTDMTINKDGAIAPPYSFYDILGLFMSGHVGDYKINCR